MWLAGSGAKASLSSAAAAKRPILREPKAAT
jgi:hypothetical protein